MSDPTYGEAVAMYGVSRQGKLKAHLVDDLANRVIKAGMVGAVILDHVDDWCIPHDSPAIMPGMCLRTWVEVPTPSSPCVIDRGIVPGRQERTDCEGEVGEAEQ